MLKRDELNWARENWKSQDFTPAKCLAASEFQIKKICAMADF
jgi:hypothetical protein